MTPSTTPASRDHLAVVDGWRGISVLMTFALAHVSTFHFEHRCIAFGKRLSARWAARGVVRAQG